VRRQAGGSARRAPGSSGTGPAWLSTLAAAGEVVDEARESGVLGTGESELSAPSACHDRRGQPRVGAQDEVALTPDVV
jgi:hypothetical protein